MTLVAESFRLVSTVIPFLGGIRSNRDHRLANVAARVDLSGSRATMIATIRTTGVILLLLLLAFGLSFFLPRQPRPDDGH